MRKLQEGQVELWLLDVKNPQPDLPNALSDEEMIFLKRLGTTKAKEKFARSRNYLRWVLGMYLDCDPKDIQLAYGAHGKPFLSHPNVNLNFNLSHSHEASLFAFSRAEIGVDIEKIESRPKLLKIAERYFSKRNIQALARLNKKNQRGLFYKLWTASEAYLKGLGSSVFSIEEVRNEIYFSKDSPAEFSSGKWKIFSIDLVSGYSSALAVKDQDPELKIVR